MHTMQLGSFPRLGKSHAPSRAPSSVGLAEMQAYKSSNLIPAFHGIPGARAGCSFGLAGYHQGRSVSNVRGLLDSVKGSANSR